MNKCELIRAIANNAGLTIKEATSAFDGFIDAITDSLKAGDKVQISGFGTFDVKKKPAREGINPKSSQKIKIPASTTPTFKFGKAYKAEF